MNAGGKARGADFSSAQPLSEVERVAHGLDFAFVKATQGTDYTNPLLAGQTNLLKKLGVRVGFYHLLQAGVDGALQWDFFEHQLVTIVGAGGAPLVLDYEMAGTTDAQARAFIRRGRQRGYRVGVYGGYTIVNRPLGQAWRWVAYWSSQPPRVRWDVWQFSDGGGRQDYNVFRGDKVELAAWWTRQGAHRGRRHRLRWWLHDEDTHTALGPYRVAAVGPAFLAYALTHRHSRRYRLVRK